MIKSRAFKKHTRFIYRFRDDKKVYRNAFIKKEKSANKKVKFFINDISPAL